MQVTRNELQEVFRRMVQPINLGYLNGWLKKPDLVRYCQDQGHKRKYETKGRCLTRVSCETCKYFFMIDSSD